MTTRFTPTQQRIMNLLSDGYGHTKEELLRCVGDEYTEWITVLMHLSKLRAILLPKKYTIACINEKDKTTWCLARIRVSYKES